MFFWGYLTWVLLHMRVLPGRILYSLDSFRWESTPVFVFLVHFSAVFFFLPSVFSCYLNYQKVLVRRPTDISPNFISSIAHQNRLPHDYASAFIERSGWMLMLGRRGCARAAQRVHWLALISVKDMLTPRQLSVAARDWDSNWCRQHFFTRSTSNILTTTGD